MLNLKARKSLLKIGSPISLLITLFFSAAAICPASGVATIVATTENTPLSAISGADGVVTIAGACTFYPHAASGWPASSYTVPSAGACAVFGGGDGRLYMESFGSSPESGVTVRRLVLGPTGKVASDDRIRTIKGAQFSGEYGGVIYSVAGNPTILIGEGVEGAGKHAAQTRLVVGRYEPQFGEALSRVYGYDGRIGVLIFGCMRFAKNEGDLSPVADQDRLFSVFTQADDFFRMSKGSVTEPSATVLSAAIDDRHNFLFCATDADGLQSGDGPSKLSDTLTQYRLLPGGRLKQVGLPKAAADPRDHQDVEDQTKLIQVYPPPPPAESFNRMAVSALAASADGRILVGAGGAAGGELYVWSTGAAGIEKLLLRNRVENGKLLPGGRVFVSADTDPGTACEYELYYNKYANEFYLTATGIIDSAQKVVRFTVSDSGKIECLPVNIDIPSGQTVTDMAFVNY